MDSRVLYFQKNSKKDCSKLHNILETAFKKKEKITLKDVVAVMESFKIQYYTRENQKYIQVFNLKNEYIFRVEKT